MFLRLLWESFVRQRRRKALAGIAILLGTTAVTAMLALATTIGDRIHRELAVYGANIVVTPKAANLDVKIGGVDLKPATGGAYLKESDLEKLKGIFWANNITGVSPELSAHQYVAADPQSKDVREEPIPAVFTGMWFGHRFGVLTTGSPQMHPWWKLEGKWPQPMNMDAINNAGDAVVGARLAMRLRLKIGDQLFYDPDRQWIAEMQLKNGRYAERVVITGIVSTGDATEDAVLLPLTDVQLIFGWEKHGVQKGATPASLGQTAAEDAVVDRVELSAKTRPEDAFARLDPDKLSPKQHDIWYCRPYANSIAYQIMEAIPGSQAEQVRRVEQTEGTVLARISGLMWLVSGAALLAAGFAVSAAMATAVLERRGEIGLMRSLGASRGAIALLFYAESGLLAVAAGAVGFVAGSGLAFWLGGRIFPETSGEPVLNGALLPVVVALALVVALAGSTPSIRAALRMDPSSVLRADA